MRNCFILLFLTFVNLNAFGQKEAQTSRWLCFANMLKGDNQAFYRPNSELSTFAFTGIRAGELTPYVINYANMLEQVNYYTRIPVVEQLSPSDWLKTITLEMEELQYYEDEDLIADENYEEEYAQSLSYYFAQDLSVISLDITATTTEEDSVSRINFINFYIAAESPDNLIGVDQYAFSLKWSEFIAYVEKHYSNRLFYTNPSDFWWRGDMLFTNGKLISEIQDTSGASLLSEILHLAFLDSSFTAQTPEKAPFDLSEITQTDNGWYDTYLTSNKKAGSRIGFVLPGIQKANARVQFDFDWVHYKKITEREQPATHFTLLVDALKKAQFQMDASRRLSSNGFYAVRQHTPPLNEEEIYGLFVEDLQKEGWLDRKLNEWQSKSSKDKKEWYQALSQEHIQIFGLDLETIESDTYQEVETFIQWEASRSNLLSKSKEVPAHDLHPDLLSVPVTAKTKFKTNKVTQLEMLQQESLDFRQPQNNIFLNDDLGLVPFIIKNIEAGTLWVYTSDSLNQVMPLVDFEENLKIPESEEVLYGAEKPEHHYLDPRELPALDITSRVQFNTKGTKIKYQIVSLQLVLPFDHPDNLFGVETTLGFVSWAELEPLLIKAASAGDISAQVRQMLNARTFFPYFKKTKHLVAAE